MRTRVPIVLLLIASAAACTDHTPTAAPADASFDGGWTIGSGGRNDSTSVTQATTGGLDETGGWTIGSGR